jgi:hypothetical protein
MKANEQGVGDRVWGVGNPILKSRGFKMDAVFLAHTWGAIHLFLFSIFKNRRLCTRWVWESVLYLHPTPHTPHPSWSQAFRLKSILLMKMVKYLNQYKI